MKNLRNKKLYITISVILAIACSLSIVVAAITYDSTNDPLISLSYLAKYVEEALQPIRASIENLGGNTSSGTTPPASSVAQVGFEAIFVEYGHQVQCTAATEVILRSGSAVIISPFDNQGLSDLTDGVDLGAGSAVPKNHNLLIPRGNDGRGIEITSTGGAYVMVGGAYIIVEP